MYVYTFFAGGFMKTKTIVASACLFLLVGLALVLNRPMAQVGQKAAGTPTKQAAPIAATPASQASEPMTNWGFEEELKGWEKTGSAFDNQPVYGDNVTVERAVAGRLISMPLGGDYWKDVAYPIGHKGGFWIGTSDRRLKQMDPAGGRQDTSLTGTLVSGSFTVSKKYVTFLVGGGKDAAKLRVELLVADSAGDVTIGGAKYKVVAGTPRTGMNHDALRREWWDVGALAGKTCRVRIADEAASGTWGYINVDDVVFTDDDPKTAKVQLGPVSVDAVASHTFVKGDTSTKGYVDWDAPIWGAAEMHAHPAAHLGFGGKLLHGDPDGPLGEAMGSCKCTHRVWEPDNMCGNLLRGIIVNQVEESYAFKNALGIDHPAEGYPDFAAWPHFSSATHQQMWYGWIRRAYEGGLRVLVALAVNSQLLAEAIDGDPPTDDRNSTDAQIAYLKTFVKNHDDFMEIAYSPAELRDIVRRNKLAVVLGTEIDNPGDLYRMLLPGYDAKTLSPALENIVGTELERQYCEGIRYQFLVHLVDNAFGGTGVYNDMFNVSNKFTSLLPLIVDNPVPSGAVFDVEGASDPLVDFRLSAPLGLPSSIVSMISGAVKKVELDPFLSMFLNSQGEYRILKSYFLTPDPRLDKYATIATGKGHQNKKGLTELGQAALKKLMDMGTMIDVDHMSAKAATAALGIADSRVPKYPLNSGHNGFRQVNSMIKQGVNETNRTDADYKKIVELGGLIGIGNGYTPLDKKKVGSTFSKKMYDIVPASYKPTKHLSQGAKNVQYDCGGSSQAFAMSYLYAVEIGGGAAVALGTDTDGIYPKTGPRFGPYATLNGNVCATQPTSTMVPYGGTTGLQKRKDGNKSWDFNYDGTAHYGMLTDFFQDLKMIGLDGADLSPLFLSAERFAQMWEKSLKSSTTTVSDATCQSRLANAKKGLGEPCGGDTDCLSNRCDKGTLTTKANKCIPNDGTGSVGDYCTSSNHCKNGNCNLNTRTCKARADIGASCKSNTDCISDRCDAGPNTTGHEKCTCKGAYCPKDAYCTHDNQCKGYCTAKNGGEGVCKDKADLKSYCDRNQMCASGACDLSVKKCVPLNGTGKEGDYCTQNANCKSNWCSGGACAPQKELGESCPGGNAQCKSGYCDAGMGSGGTNKCVPAAGTGNTGDYCSNNGHCKSSWCSGNKCASKKELGESCPGGNGQCKSGYCDAGMGSGGTNKCVPAGGTGKTGDYCSQNGHCKPGHSCVGNKCN
jgi:microsomal dipeptidase-like Zn-dependent dipeptidase